MTAHTRTEHGLAVAFHRDGREIDRDMTAATGEIALLTAIAMLRRRKALQDGDRLTVTEAVAS
jgi:hypothetical protein